MMWIGSLLPSSVCISHSRSMVLGSISMASFETPVAHDPVDLLERVGVVLAILLVGDGQRFFGVDVEKGDRARRAEGGDDVGRASAHAQKRSGQAAEDSLLTQYQRATPCPDRSRRTLRYLSCRLPVCDRHSRSLRVNRQSLTAGNHGEPTRYARNGGRSGLSCGNFLALLPTKPLAACANAIQSSEAAERRVDEITDA